MADGRVVIQIKADDKELVQAENSMERFTGSILAARAVEKVFDAIANSVDGAVKRIDTLNQYPRVLSRMGASAEDAGRSIDRLSDGTMGLPVKLDDVASTAQRMFTVFRDADTATESTLALNNALLASGATTNETANATDQYVKMMSSGKVEMDNWNTLSETMSYALSEVAGKLGYSTTNTWELYNALKSGEVSLSEFNDAMIEASTETGGFADVAKDATSGIGTAWMRVQSAITIGVAKVIEAFDDWLHAAGFGGIEGVLDDIREAVNAAFGAVESAMRIATPLVSGFFNVVSSGISVVSALDFAIIGLIASIGTFKILTKVTSWIEATNLVIKAITASQAKWSTVTLAGSKIIGNATVAQRVFATAVALLTGKISLATLATGAFNTVLTALTGPIGWVTLAIGLLVAAGVGLYKWLNSTTPEVEAMSEEMANAADETNSLIEATESSARAYEKRQESITTQTAALQTLIDETFALTEAEGVNAAEKKVLEENVESLNSQIQGLNLAYDEEAGKLSQSAEAVYKRVEAMEAEERLIASQERLQEISSERAEIELQLEANTRLMNEAQAESEELSWLQIGSRRELNARTEELQGSNEELRLRLEELGATEEVVTQQQLENAEAVAAAEEDSKNRRINSMNELTETQAATVEAMQSRYSELKDTTINNFQEIEQNVDLTMESVRQALESNIETMTQWSENMQILSNKGVDEGMLMELQRLGPEGAPLVAELVNASDAELQEMSELFAEAGETSKNVMFDELGIEEGDTIDGIPELVTSVESSWTEGLNTSSISKVLPEEIEKGKEDAVEAGKNVAEGAAQGIEQGTESAAEASRTMGQTVNEVFGAELGIQSPSTVFIQHGRDIINGLLQGFDQGKPQVVASVRELGSTITTTMTQSIQSMSTDSSGMLSEFVTNVQSSFTRAKSIVTSETDGMTSSFRRGLNQMVIASRTEFSRIEQTSSDAFQGMSKNINSETNSITRTIRTSMTQMTRTTQQGIRQIEQTYNQGFTRIGNTANRETNKLTRLVTTSMRTQENVVRNGMRSQQSVVRSGYSAMVSQVRTSMNSVLSTTRSTMNQAVSIMRGTANHARSAGFNMGLGFRNGLASTQNSIMATARSLANRAANAIRSALKIHSPSRVTYGLGEYFGEGFLGGIESMERGVGKAGNRLAESAIPRINPMSSFGRARDAAGATIINNYSQPRSNQEELIQALSKMEVRLDGDKTIGHLFPRINRYGGEATQHEERWGRA